MTSINENYITVFATYFLLLHVLVAVKLKDMGHATRTGVQDQNHGRP